MLLAAGTFLLIFAAFLAPRAAAAPVALSEGSLDWGFKESFRAYAGAGELGGGATANADGTYHFELASGTRDDEAGTLSAQFAGSVRYVAHCEFVPCALDLTLADPRVEIGPEGAALYADLTNYDFFGTGQVVSSPDTRFATLATTEGGTPPVGAGVSAWGDLTATLTAEGAAAFAGYYQPGQVLDPVTVTDGPPLVEEWTDPGAYFYEEAGTAPLSGVARWIATDGANSEVWVLTGRQVSVLDAGTLAVKDSVTAAADTYGDVGFLDPASRTAFFRSDPDQAAEDTITAVSWDGTDLSTEVLPGPLAGSAASPVWAYDGVAERLVVSGGHRTVAYVRDGSGGWTYEDFGDKPCGTGSSSYSFNALLATSDGTVLARHLGGLFPIEFSGGAIQCGAEIPGSNPPGRGVPQLAEDGQGNVHIVRQSPITPEDEDPESGFDLVLAPKAGGGYEVDGAARPFSGRPALGQAVIDPNELSLYVGAGGAGGRAWVNWFDAVKFHKMLLPGFSPAPGGAIGVVNWTIFASEVVGSGPSAEHSLVAYTEAGTTPSFSAQPQGVTETLSDADPTATVSFTAAAGGSPSPTLRWQTKAPGGTAWVDVPGATAGTLEVEVDRADDGRGYRAVAANAGGEVPSAVAPVTIRTAPALTAQPADLTVAAGADATVRLHYSGNPAPEVQWQRKDGKFWTAIGADEGDFEIIEGSLVVRDTREEMSGVELRARIRNVLGTVYTRTVKLTVEAPPADVVTFGSGHADWGVKASFRSYIEGPIAHGSYTALEGAQRNADGTIRFEVIGGEAEWGSGSGELVLNGAVRFRGHDSGSGPLLELKIDDPRLEWGGGEAALFADVTSRSLSSGAVEQFPGVELAAVDFGGGPTATSQGLAIGAAPMTLTTAGAPAFGGFYAAGAGLDPITALAIEGVPRAEPPADPAPKQDPEGQPAAIPQQAPAPAVTRPRLAAPKRALAVGRNGSAAIATVACPAGGPACSIEAPRTVRVKIAGESFRARVRVPKRLGAGQQARVRLTLPHGAAGALAGRRVRIVLPLSIWAGSEELKTQVRAILKRSAG